jgi:hypothetical protein
MKQPMPSDAVLRFLSLGSVGGNGAAAPDAAVHSNWDNSCRFARVPRQRVMIKPVSNYQ